MPFKSTFVTAKMKVKQIDWLILCSLGLIWGSSFILMKRGLDAYTSEQVAALRIGLAAIALMPFHLKIKRPDFKKYWKGLVLMGCFGNLIPAFLFTKAETQISSSLTGMLNALTPLFTILLAFWWLKHRPKPKEISGIVIGFAGAILLLAQSPDGAGNGNPLYGLLVVVATICYAISITGIKKYLNDLDSLSATVWAFTLTGPAALLYLFGCTDFTNAFLSHPLALTSFGYICILALIGTAFSVVIYNTLIRRAGAVFASSCTYLIPVVAIFWGIFDGETISMLQIGAILLIILSVYLITRK
ncbi:MAG: EamA family transporter [Sediminibacterium sp.]|nr:EamA family transporter [Sediminibacterium sp.]